MWRSSSINTHFLNYFIYLFIYILSKTDVKTYFELGVYQKLIENLNLWYLSTLEITYSLTFIFPLF